VLFSSRIGVLLCPTWASRCYQQLPRGYAAFFQLAINEIRLYLLLVNMYRRDLLDEISARQGSQLEQGLTELLIGVIGPRTSSGTNSLIRQPAMTLLRKIGGTGHLRVVNAFLDSESQYAKLDAIKEGLTTGDTETIRKLREITVSDHQWDGHPVLQMEAMMALAAHGDALGLILAAIHPDLPVPSGLEDWLKPNLKNKDEAINHALSILQARSKAELSGAISMLGLLKFTPAVEDIAQILNDPPDEGVRLATILALGRMGEAAEGATEPLKRQIANNQYKYHAYFSLLQIDTPASRNAIIESLSRQWDVRFAIALTEYDDTREVATKLLISRLGDENSRSTGGFLNDNQEFLSSAPDKTLGRILQELPALCDSVRETALAGEGGLWIVGSKADAIRALAVVDPYTATLAAAKALTDRTSRDRQMYPPLLYRLDAERARNTFLRVAVDEPNAAVEWAMASAMTSGDKTWLIEQLVSKSSEKRYAACILSRILAGVDKQLGETLDQLLWDPSAKVREAAATVLDHCRQMAWVELLLQQGNDQNLDESHAWMIIDALLTTASVGYQGTAFPSWVHRLWKNSLLQNCPALRAVLDENLGSRRKKAIEGAEREAKGK